MEKYKEITDSNKENLLKQINKLAEEGWKLNGGITESYQPVVEDGHGASYGGTTYKAIIERI